MAKGGNMEKMLPVLADLKTLSQLPQQAAEKAHLTNSKHPNIALVKQVTSQRVTESRAFQKIVEYQRGFPLINGRVTLRGAWEVVF